MTASVTTFYKIRGLCRMDIDDFHHINGTYGDVEYAKAWGSPEAIARAESQAQQVKAAKLRAARELMRVYEEEERALILLLIIYIARN